MSWLTKWIMVNPPNAPFYVLENAKARPPQKLFSFFGVDWLGTGLWWINPIWVLGVGELLTFWLGPGITLGERLFSGVLYGLLIAFSMFWHQVGGIVAGRLVGAPMSAVVYSATLAFNLYQDPVDYPSRVHLVRALGGPGGNFILGVAALALNAIIGGNPFVLVLALVNLLFSGMAMIPIPTMDGGSVLHELRHWRSG